MGRNKRKTIIHFSMAAPMSECGANAKAAKLRSWERAAMRAVVQCVSEAVGDGGGRAVGAIGKGYAILLGWAMATPGLRQLRLWRKIARCAYFEDEQGKTNLSLADVGGEVLVVSQFTLYANCRKKSPLVHGRSRPGHRPAALRALRRAGPHRRLRGGDGRVQGAP